MRRPGRWLIAYVLPPLALFVLIVLVWGTIARVWNSAYLLPEPMQVWKTAQANAGQLLTATCVTGEGALAGLGLSLLAGTAVAFVFSQSRLIQRAVYPYAIFLQTVPIIAIAPLVILWFGNGFRSVVVVAFILSLFPIINNVTAGLTTVDPNLLELFAVHNATRWQVLLKLRLPNAVPYLVDGARIACGLSVVGAIVGEIYAGYSDSFGLGYLIASAANRLETDYLFAVVICSTLLGVAIFSSVSLIGATILVRWQTTTAEPSTRPETPLKEDSMQPLGRLMIITGLALSFSFGCQKQPTSDAKPGLEKVTLALNWYPEAEHGGFYAALANGYYEQEGLDVTILPGGPDSPVLQLVAQQRVTFGVTNADNVLLGRAQHAPVVALMAPLQTSPRCLIVHEKSGVKKFEDLHDLSLAMSPGAAFATYLKKKLPLENVQFVPYAGSVAPFLANEKYAQQGYVFSEPYVARKQGGDPHVLMLSDLGFNPYTSLLITSEKELRARPEVVRKMVTASVRGWIEYVRSPEAANKLIHERNPKMDLDVLEYGAKTNQPLVMADLQSDANVGQMTRERWQQLADQLIESDQIAADKVDVDQAFTTKFLAPGREDDVGTRK